MAKTIITCTDCKQSFAGQDECGAEIKWNNHECPAEAELMAMSLEELRTLITGEQK